MNCEKRKKHLAKQRNLIPRYGELWDCEGRVAFIADNSANENDLIWVMDWNTGERGDARLDALDLRHDRNSLSEQDVLEKFTRWARKGNSDAMWFLAWYFEGRNHHKSTWYYFAALRANPTQYSWAYSRIVSDAKSAYTCSGIPSPNLDFLEDIPEMHGPKIYCKLWSQAIESAEKSIHIPSDLQAISGRVLIVDKCIQNICSD